MHLYAQVPLSSILGGCDLVNRSVGTNNKAPSPWVEEDSGVPGERLLQPVWDPVLGSFGCQETCHRPPGLSLWIPEPPFPGACVKFSGAAITNGHQLVAENNRTVLSRGSGGVWNLKSRQLKGVQSRAPSETFCQNSSLAPPTFCWSLASLCL